ncbi:DsbA family protein [Atopomonas hussainii]|uniref:DsbA family protein n=1 Tax=Atopomonas hussainii TaxID=1429083 RepID=UPI00090038F3|nr:DsbA family protein [Atopomonas hussainii]
MARLIYVMDPMCSWCWGFAPVQQRLAQLAEQHGVPCEWRVGGLRRGGAPLEPAKREAILHHWHAVAEATGQPFQHQGALPEGFIYDTEPACRALVAVGALAPELQSAYAAAVQRAFYAQGQDVTAAPVLADVAAELGIPRIEFVDQFDSAACRAATEADFAWVEQLGIAGFPTLLAEDQGRLALLTNGYQPLTALQPLLERWLAQVAPNA